MNIKRNLLKKRRAAAKAVINQLPKPPIVDGICGCGCKHRPTKGACPQFILKNAGSDRCAVCDHAIVCHRRKGEQPPKTWDFPAIFGERFLVKFAPADHPLRKQINESYIEWLRRLRIHREAQNPVNQHRQEIRQAVGEAVSHHVALSMRPSDDGGGPCNPDIAGAHAGEIPAQEEPAR